MDAARTIVEEQIIKAIESEMTEKAINTNPFLSPKAHAQRLSQLVEDALEELCRHVKHGIDLLQQAIQVLEPTYMSELSSLLKGLDDVLMRQKELPIFATEEEVYLLVNLAAKFIEQEQLVGASDLLLFLLLVIPNSASLWIAAGWVVQLQKEWEKALKMYEQACSLNPNNPELLLRRCECHYELNEIDVAKEVLLRLRELQGMVPDLAIFSKKISILKKKLCLNDPF